jgi:hypothetical protein
VLQETNDDRHAADRREIPVSSPRLSATCREEREELVK